MHVVPESARVASEAARTRTPERRIKNNRHVGAPRCCAASCTMRLQRSARFPAAAARCFSVAAQSPAQWPQLQLGSLLDGPLHVIELVDGHHQGNGSAGSASSSAMRLKRTSPRRPLPPARERRVAATTSASMPAARARRGSCVRPARPPGLRWPRPMLGNPAAACHRSLSVPRAYSVILSQKTNPCPKNTSGSAGSVP